MIDELHKQIEDIQKDALKYAALQESNEALFNKELHKLESNPALAQFMKDSFKEAKDKTLDMDAFISNFKNLADAS